MPTQPINTARQGCIWQAWLGLSHAFGTNRQARPGWARTVKPELAIVDSIAALLVSHVLYPHTLDHGHVLQRMPAMLSSKWEKQVRPKHYADSAAAVNPKPALAAAFSMGNACRFRSRAP